MPALNDVLKALDRKDRTFFKKLPVEEQKKVSAFLNLRYASSVVGSTEIEEYYLLSANKHANESLFDLSKFPDLQWLICTTVSPGIGGQRHKWIKNPSNKTSSSNGKIVKFLKKVYPFAKDDDISVMEKVMSVDDIINLAVEMGYDDKQIRSELG